MLNYLFFSVLQGSFLRISLDSHTTNESACIHSLWPCRNAFTELKFDRKYETLLQRAIQGSSIWMASLCLTVSCSVTDELIKGLHDCSYLKCSNRKKYIFIYFCFCKWITWFSFIRQQWNLIYFSFALIVRKA